MANERLMCVDRVIPSYLSAEASACAIAEHPGNGVDPTQPTRKLALVRKKMWQPGRTLGVRFLDGSAKLQQRVQQYASAWTEHANVRFDFAGGVGAEIRISFAADPGSSWSALGTDCRVDRYFPAHQPTMSFGWFTDDTPEDELSRVIVHEFGHALGCVHEHQNPANGIEWNERAVLAYYAGPPNHWDEAAIRHNILEKYAADQLRGTAYDRDSIMLYPFPASLVKSGVATPVNTRLSAGDIAFIRQAYPRA